MATSLTLESAGAFTAAGASQAVLEHGIDRAVPVPDLEGVLDGTPDELFGSSHRGQGLESFGQPRGDSGREHASTAMRVRSRHSSPCQLDHVGAVPIHVSHITFGVTALDHGGPNTKRDEVTRGASALCQRLYPPAKDDLRFVQVGCDHSRQWDEPLTQRVDRVITKQPCAALGDHHGVDDEVLDAVLCDCLLY